MAEAFLAKPPPASYSYDEEGKEEHILGLDIYVAAPASNSTTKAVIFAPDVFGWKAPLLRKLADKFASKGYLVLVPDYVKGDAFKDDFSRVGNWKQNYPPTKYVDVTLELIEYLKKTKGVADVGISGFCWGAKLAFAVGASADHPAKTLVLLHPDLIGPKDFQDVKVPVAILAAESDGCDKFESSIDQRKEEVEIFLKIFKHLHGWTTRYDPSKEEQVKAAEEAHAIMLDWYSKHL